jgi:hypothetical protein
MQMHLLSSARPLASQHYYVAFGDLLNRFDQQTTARPDFPEKKDSKDCDILILPANHMETTKNREADLPARLRRASAEQGQ